MAQSDQSAAQPLHPVSLGKRMVLGAGIAFLVITVFLFQVKHPHPEWGQLWMIRPLLVVTFAGAMGGVCFFLMDYLRQQGGFRKIMANVLSLIIYLVGLWMGIILGLVGTMWH